MTVIIVHIIIMHSMMMQTSALIIKHMSVRRSEITEKGKEKLEL